MNKFVIMQVSKSRWAVGQWVEFSPGMIDSGKISDGVVNKGLVEDAMYFWIITKPLSQKSATQTYLALTHIGNEWSRREWPERFVSHFSEEDSRYPSPGSDLLT